MINKKRNVIRYILLVIGLVTMVVSGVYLYRYYSDIHQSEKTHDSVKDLIITETPTTSIKENTNDNNTTEQHEPVIIPSISGVNITLPNDKYALIWQENNDFVGWITVPGTNIDYAVMHTPTNEEYYLHKNFYKQYDYSGVPFCSAISDVETPSDNVLIYGHHMQAGNMFSDMDLYKKQEFYEDHKLFTFDTLYRNATYEIISVVRTDVNPGCYQYWDIATCTEDEFNEYVSWIKKKALYKTDLIDTVEYGDKLVTLSTCNYHVENGRLLIIGKMIESEEFMEQPVEEITDETIDESDVTVNK